MWIMSCWSYKNIHSFFSLVDLLFMLCHHSVNICNKAFGFAFYESCLLYRFYFPFCNFFLFFFFSGKENSIILKENYTGCQDLPTQPVKL